MITPVASGAFIDVAMVPKRSPEVLNQGTPAAFASRAISRASSRVEASGDDSYLKGNPNRAARSVRDQAAAAVNRLSIGRH